MRKVIPALLLGSLVGTLTLSSYAHSIPNLPPQQRRNELINSDPASHLSTRADSGPQPPANASQLEANIKPGDPESVPSYTLSTTFKAGDINQFLADAPPLPDRAQVSPSSFPPLDKTPPIDSAQAKAWLKQYDLSSVPNITVNVDGATCADNPQNAKDAAQNHWWSCGGYTAPGDIVACPDTNTWGLTYDDGPSPYNPKLLDYFENHGDLKSTFFVVGSRAISYPDILQYEYMKGHELSVHTWSHTALTTLTNEQIVVELQWTKEVIRNITGVTPTTMRPPYGDCDDRVRAICKILGLTPIMWTSTTNGSFDTEDWELDSGEVTAATVVNNFQKILAAAPSMNSGYIVLEHDLYPQSVDAAVELLLPMAQSMQPEQTLEPVLQCLGQNLSAAYVETRGSSAGTTSTKAASNSTSTQPSHAEAAPASQSTISSSSGGGRAPIMGAPAVVWAVLIVLSLSMTAFDFPLAR